MTSHDALVDKLNDGYIMRPRRWSGDTHAGEEGGEVDVDATEALMREAADAINQLTAERDALKANAERYRNITNLSSTVHAAIFSIVGENCDPKNILTKPEADALIDAATAKESNHATTGHCKEREKPGGCQLHNLHCSYPACDTKGKS